MNTLAEIYQLINDATNQLRKARLAMEEWEGEIKEAIREGRLDSSAANVTLGWLGVGGAPFSIREFDDGVTFVAYQASLIPDWDLIRAGHSDVTGEKWRPYNKGKPALNEYELRGLDQSEEARMQRLRDYDGPLRHSLDKWPDEYRRVFLETHNPDGSRK